MSRTATSKRVISRTVPALLIGMLAALPASAQTAITWKLNKGDKLSYKFQQTNDIKVTLNGTDINNRTELDVNLNWTVEDVQGDIATITQVIDQAKVKITTQNGTIEYDSKNKKEDPGTAQIGKIYDSVINEKYTLKMNKLGEITEVIVPEKVTNAVKGSPFERLADSGSLLSPKGIQRMMAQVLPKLTDKQIAPKGTWTSTVDLPAEPILMKLETTYTLTSTDANKTLIDGKIDTKITAAEGAPLQVKVSKQSGESHFVLNGSGKMASSQIKQSFDMVISVNNQEIPQSININASMLLK